MISIWIAQQLGSAKILNSIETLFQTLLIVNSIQLYKVFVLLHLRVLACSQNLLLPLGRSMNEVKTTSLCHILKWWRNINLSFRSFFLPPLSNSCKKKQCSKPFVIGRKFCETISQNVRFGNYYSYFGNACLWLKLQPVFVHGEQKKQDVKSIILTGEDRPNVDCRIFRIIKQ